MLKTVFFFSSSLLLFGLQKTHGVHWAESLFVFPSMNSTTGQREQWICDRLNAWKEKDRPKQCTCGWSSIDFVQTGRTMSRMHLLVRTQLVRISFRWCWFTVTCAFNANFRWNAIDKKSFSRLSRARRQHFGVDDTKIDFWTMKNLKAEREKLFVFGEWITIAGRWFFPLVFFHYFHSSLRSRARIHTHSTFHSCATIFVTQEYKVRRFVDCGAVNESNRNKTNEKCNDQIVSSKID